MYNINVNVWKIKKGRHYDGLNIEDKDRFHVYREAIRNKSAPPIWNRKIFV